MSIKPYFPAPLRGLLGSAKLHSKSWFLRDEQARDILRWRRDRGDQTLRLSYPLEPDDVVFDLGGFAGDFAAAIHKKYGCSVYLFEPVRSFFAACEVRFAGNEKIHCFNYGLSSLKESRRISLNGDASSMERDSAGDLETIHLQRFDRFLESFDLAEVALLKINIEGGEFDVLEHLVETGTISRVRHLQIQFHDFVEDAAARRDRIRVALGETHDLLWNYHFVWESWSRR